MKPWYKSRTIWFNLMAALLMATQMILDEKIIDDKFLLICVILVNAILRVVTKESIKFPSKINYS